MRLLSCLLLSLFIFSCNNSSVPDVEDIKVDLSVKRFEKELFSLDTNQLATQVDQLIARYPSFGENFITTILNTDPNWSGDSANAYLSSSGTGTFTFSNISNGVPYFIQLKHRNSLETWSDSARSFVNNSLAYDFSTSASKAFGNNMIKVRPEPVRYAIYSGDVYQDGFIDLSDISLVYNDASIFATGYLPTDINGDDIIDLSDLVITYNNSSNFVERKIP